MGNTYGNDWMHRTLISILKHIDVRILYIFTYIFVIPPCLVFRYGYKPIYHYFRKRHKLSPWESFKKTYANHCLFGQMVIDKFAMYAGKNFDVRTEGYQYFKTLARGNYGFVQLSSHIGNYEIAGYTLVAEDKTLNALVYANEKASVMNNRAKMFDRTHICMIPITEDMSHIFAINEALGRNEIVSMPADRVVGSQKTINVEFLGEKATFPIGPFAVATMRQSEVIMVNVMKTGTKQYTIFVHPLCYDKTLSREEQVRQLASGYVAELEKILKTYPTQWFNYFEFWTP